MYDQVLRSAIFNCTTKSPSRDKGFRYIRVLSRGQLLAFPLFYVYYKDTAVGDTFYSLQTLVGIVLPIYPLTRTTRPPLHVVESISCRRALRCFETKPIPNRVLVYSNLYE